MASVPPRSSAASADRHQLAGGREEDRRVERLGRRLVASPGRRGAELAARAAARRRERVITCTVAPSASATCAARWAEAPKP